MSRRWFFLTPAAPLRRLPSDIHNKRTKPRHKRDQSPLEAVLILTSVFDRRDHEADGLQELDFETQWLNDLGRVCGVLDGLDVQYERARLAPLVGAKEHAKDHQKVGTALPVQEAERRAARFRELLEHLATKAPRQI
jgi:hypothetical protein